MKVMFEKNTTQENKGVVENAAAMCTLEEAARHIRALGDHLWVYVGGSHISIHRETHNTDKGPRLAIITED